MQVTDRITKCLGLVVQFNPLQTAPGALIKADNCIIDRENIVEDRRGYASYFTLGSNTNELMVYSNTVLTHAGTTVSYDNSGTPANYSGSYNAPSGQKMRFVEGFSNLYVTTDKGVQVFSDLAGTAAKFAGSPRSLDPSYVLNSGSTGFLVPGNQCAYRATLVKVDSNNNQIEGYPSTRMWVTNSGVAASGTITCAAVNAADTVTINGIVLTAVAGTSTLDQFNQSGSNAQTAANLAAAINGDPTLATLVVATVSSNVVTVTTLSIGSSGNSITFVSSTGVRLAVSGAGTLTSGSGTNKNIDITLYLPSEVTTSYVIRFYRTNSTTTGTTTDSAGDEMQLVYQYQPNSTDISNGYITFTDSITDALRGATLYTSPSQGGIQLGADRPPVCKDLALFRSTFMCYANTSTKQRQFLTMIGTTKLGGTITGTTHTSTTIDGISATDIAKLYVGMKISGSGIAANTTISTIGASSITINNATGSSASGITITYITQYSITIGGTTFTFDTAENASSGVIAVSVTGTASVDIDLTARSMVRVMNRYASNTTVYAYYDSGPNDPPGLMHFDERGIGASAFTTQVSNANIQTQFSAGGTQPPVSPTTTTQCTSSNQVQKNAIYIAQDGQLESVPTLQYKLAGSTSKNILRIAALRDSLIIIKEDGVYRMTGNAVSNFDIAPLDLTVICKSADSIAVLANQVFMLSNQGVVSISENGVQVVSREIEPNIRPLLGFTNIGTLATGCAYESDRAYILSLSTLATDTVQNQIYRYNIFTRTWTHWTFGFNAAVVESNQDKIFFSKPNSAIVYRERKDFLDSDYADPESAITITSINLTTNKVVFTLSGATPVVGWSVLQGTTSIAIKTITNVGTTYTAILAQTIPSSWVTGAATIYPHVGFDIEWDTWTGGAQGIGRLKQVSEVVALTDNIPSNNTATSVNITFRSNFDDTRDAVPILIGGGGGAGWGSSWGSSPWGSSGTDPYGYRQWVPRNKQYCHLLNVGLQHLAAREKVVCAGLAFLYQDVSEVVGR